jgi:choline-sulfatase
VRARRRSWRPLVVFCFAAFVSCSRNAPPGAARTDEGVLSSRASVLLITLDTTRADHIEPYGALKASTPALAGLAEDGIVFERAYAVAPVTGPAHASILTGLYPPRHGVRNNLMHHLPADVTTLAERLSASGYRTAAFVSAVVLERRYGLDQGFEVYNDDLRSSIAPQATHMVTERPAAATADLALAWLDNLESGDPYFLWVHFYDPHLPYAPPAPWADRFRDRPYDGEIAAMDEQIGRLLQHPRVAADDVVVVAIGDHGEGLGEHGEEAHGLLIYDSTLHVPWILRLPGGPSGRRVSSPVSQVDLVPTLADLLALEPEDGPGAFDGRSLLPLLGGDSESPDRPLFAESEVPFFTYGWARLRAVRQGAIKLIDAPVQELYNLDHDPGENRNLARDHAADVRRMEAEVERWTAGDRDADTTLAVDSQTAEELRALGYLAGDPGRPEGEGRGNPVELIAVHEELLAVGELLASGRPAAAVERVRQALASDPDNLAALTDLSRGLVQLGRLDEAAVVAARASDVAPWSARAPMVEADIEYRRGRFTRALELIDRSLRLDDRFLEARLDRARYLGALGRNAEAAAELEPLLKESGDNPWVLVRYAEIVELGTGKYRAAEQRLRAVLANSPQIADAWLALGTALERDGREPEAAEVYRRAIAMRVNNPDLPARLALLLAGENDPTAETALREAIRISPVVRADLHVALGECLAALGRADEARRQYETAAAASTFSVGTRNAKAMALLQLGRASEAETVWLELVHDQPAYGRAWLNLASLSIQRGQWQDAERYAREAVAREPRSGSAWNNLGIGLEELGRLDEAEAAYRRAAEVDAEDWRALFNLGLLLRKSSRFAEAAVVQQQVLDRAPSHAGAHFELGALYAGPLADIERAKAHLQATIGAEPDGPRARQARAILDRLP